MHFTTTVALLAGVSIAIPNVSSALGKPECPVSLRDQGQVRNA